MITLCEAAAWEEERERLEKRVRDLKARNNKLERGVSRLESKVQQKQRELDIAFKAMLGIGQQDDSAREDDGHVPLESKPAQNSASAHAPVATKAAPRWLFIHSLEDDPDYTPGPNMNDIFQDTPPF